MVTQHHPVAVQCADRLFEIDLDKAGLPRRDRTLREHGDAADDVGCAEMEMDGQPIAQRRLSKARHPHQEIEPPRRRMPLGRHNPIAAARFAPLRKRAADIDRATLAGGGTLDRVVL